jgi:hypothetical protein
MEIRNGYVFFTAISTRTYIAGSLLMFGCGGESQDMPVLQSSSSGMCWNPGTRGLVLFSLLAIGDNQYERLVAPGG